MPALAVALAVLAAAFNASSSVLQRRALACEPPDPVSGRRRVPGLRTLVRRPWWLVGLLALVMAGVCQAAALTVGRLALVQPVMAGELLFTLVLGALVFRTRPGRRAVVSFVALAAGLAVFLPAAAPHGGHPHVDSGRWLVTGPPALAAVVLLMCSARRLRSAPQAAVFAVATAIGFAFTAALMKDAMATLDEQGLGAMLAGWQPYATALAGVASTWLLQLALQAGTLVASQPALTLGDALLSVVLGWVLFGEEIRLGLRVLPELLGLALIVVGSVELARAPEIAAEHPAGQVGI